MLDKAIQIAKKAHANQTDKGGKPYIDHVLRVMDAVEGEKEKICAVLHDTIEDTPVTLAQLEEEGFDKDVLNTLKTITKKEDEDYFDYISRVCLNETACKIKLADLKDNMDISRIANPSQKDFERVEKYKKAEKIIRENIVKFKINREVNMLNKLYLEMIKFFNGDPKRIQHFIKVHSLARIIGIGEKLDEKTQFILEAAAYTHDIGIRVAEREYGFSNGKLQEELGPAEAEKMLKNLGFEPDVIERVCYLIAHHHSYKNIDSIDYRILVEADFMVNLFEDNCKKEVVKDVYDRMFETETGKLICSQMFGL